MAIRNFSARLRIAALASAALGSTAGYPALAADCELKKVAALPADYAPGRPLVVDARLNDRPVKLALATASALNVLNQDFADHFPLQELDSGFDIAKSAGGRTHAGAHVDRLSLDRLTLRGPEFVLLHTGGGGNDGRAVGLLGASSLKTFNVELDPAHGLVNLFLAQACTTGGAYWAKEYFRVPAQLTFDDRLEAEITVNGKTVLAEIDTGAVVSRIDQAFARQDLGIAAAPADDMRDVKANTLDDIQLHRLLSGVMITSTVELRGSTNPGYTPNAVNKVATTVETISASDMVKHSFDTLGFGGVTLHHAELVVTDTAPLKVLTQTGTMIPAQYNEELPKATLGMATLRHFHMFINYAEPAIYLTPFEDPAPVQNGSRSSISSSG